MTLRVLVVDDEGVSRRRIRRYLSADPDIDVVGECGDGASAVDSIRALAPDVVFLDVQMPELDGFAVLEALTPTALPAVVFVTAFDRYALKAFDAHAIDYLLKPFTRDRFAVALARVRERLARRDSGERLAALMDALRRTPSLPERVAVRSGDRLVVIDWVAVDWIEAADNYVRLHAGSSEYLLRQTLSALEKELDANRFVRIHRSVIVQIDRVAELFPETHGDFTVQLGNGTRLAMSRTYRDRVERAVRWPK